VKCSAIFKFDILFFLFCHGLYAFSADRQPFAVDFFNLQINILPVSSFDIGMGSGGVFS